jgi:hypothetical protein
MVRFKSSPEQQLTVYAFANPGRPIHTFKRADVRPILVRGKLGDWVEGFIAFASI